MGAKQNAPPAAGSSGPGAPAHLAGTPAARRDGASSGPAAPDGAPRDIVVIGASAGGVEALKAVLGALPPDYDGSVCVVLHIPPAVPSVLAHILGRSTHLVCVSAYHNAPVRRGVVYVAPPDHHLLLDHGRVRLVRGPRENGHRPGIDPLFRSAAAAYGSRVVGVVLTGNLDDGTRGLRAIKEHGGMAVVQSPDDALYPSMPQSAVEHVDVDWIGPASEIGPLLAAVAQGATWPLPSPAPLAPSVASNAPPDALDAEEPDENVSRADGADANGAGAHGAGAHGADAPDADPLDPAVLKTTAPGMGATGGATGGARDAEAVRDDPLLRVADLATGIGEVDGGARINESLGGNLSGYTCPECKGALWELHEGTLVRFRCRVGHSYTEAGLVDHKARRVEDVLWTAVTALEESAALANRVADRAMRHGRPGTAETFRARAQHLESRGTLLRDLLDGVPGHIDAD